MLIATVVHRVHSLCVCECVCGACRGIWQKGKTKSNFPHGESFAVVAVVKQVIKPFLVALFFSLLSAVN